MKTFRLWLFTALSLVLLGAGAVTLGHAGNASPMATSTTTSNSGMPWLD